MNSRTSISGAELISLGRECTAIATKNGFDKPTWDNFPTKMMLVITETDEGHDAVIGTGKDPIEEELADVAIRLLSILDATWDEWTPRSARLASTNPYERYEVMVWPIIKSVCKAIESWRKDDKLDTRTHTELALLNTFRFAERINVDIASAIDRKMEKNRNRPFLHGKKKKDG